MFSFKISVLLLTTVLLTTFAMHTYSFLSIAVELCSPMQYEEGDPYDCNLNYVKNQLMTYTFKISAHNPNVFGCFLCHLGFGMCCKLAVEMVHTLEHDCPRAMGAQLNTTDGLSLRYEYYKFYPD